MRLLQHDGREPQPTTSVAVSAPTSTTLPKLSAATLPQAVLPSVLTPARWSDLAEHDEFVQVAAFLLTAAEPGAAPSRMNLLTSLLEMRGYTRAELLLIAKEGPFRPMYGPYVRPDVLDAIVQESRKFRAMEGRVYTQREYDDALRVTDLTADDFSQTGRDQKSGLPQYRVRVTAFQNAATQVGPGSEAPTLLAARKEADAFEARMKREGLDLDTGLRPLGAVPALLARPDSGGNDAA